MEPHHGLDLDATTLDIYDLLRRQPGDAFSAAVLAEQLDESIEPINGGIATLERLGLVNRLEDAGAEPTFIISPSAPEL